VLAIEEGDKAGRTRTYQSGGVVGLFHLLLGPRELGYWVVACE
jgi:hypothetical protein